ncbi:MAG: NAD-dependent epimerase/dehydratase family protein [Flavobacteriales bacterium]|jgi:nucleoside-diphosphate-sugar epimerase|nr:NAD-dependent epimerase/dehydratase family protein [Flavobacteriales bacterium]
MTKRILITGGTGFIGKYFIEEALERNYEVYLAIRKSSKTAHLSTYNIQFITIDYRSTSSIRESFEKANIQAGFFDHIIHNAGVKDAVKSETFYKYNATLTRDLAMVLKEEKILKGRFVFISSLAALGPGNPISRENITEKKTVQPISPYGRSKALAEKHLKNTGIEYLILRPTAVYGKGSNDYDILVSAIKKGVVFYLGEKNQSLSFIHADDVSKITFELLDTSIINESFLLSDGNEYNTTAFFNTIAQELQKKIRLRIVIPKFLLFTIAYIQQKLGIISPMNSVEKYREVTSKNWKCTSKKLYGTISYRPIHKVSEVADIAN